VYSTWRNIRKLRRHFSAEHGHPHDKAPNYFKRFLRSYETASTSSITKFKVAERAHEERNLVPEIIAKELKSHTTRDTLIGPAYEATVRMMSKT
jgi:hypothetical protein